MNDITFVLGQGGLGRPLANEDHTSGMIFYVANGSLPSGFSTTNRVKLFTSTAEAEAAGIKADYADATAATGSVAITTAGTNGDTINASVQVPLERMDSKGATTAIINFGTYVKAAGEANATAVGDKIAALVNLNTLSHGFSAVNGAGTVTITAPKKYGISLHAGTKLITTIVGATMAATTTQFTGGVASLQAAWHYHISEFFRMQPKGFLYAGFYAIPGGAYDYAEVGSVQNFSGGKIRQIGVYKTSAALSGADLTALHAACLGQETLHKDIMGVLGADISATVDLTTLVDAAALAAPYAHADLGQDGGALGAFLYATTGKSITTMGATLGAIALASVSESVAWVEKFNMSNGTELDTPALANGVLIRDVAQTTLDLLQGRALNFLRTFVGVAGSYRNETRTAVTQTSDYAYVENVRTIQKARRVVYTSTIPSLNSKVVLNKDGTLTDDTIEYFTNLAERNLFQMQRDQEISNFGVVISSVQNVLSTGKLIISISVQPIGVARNIVINIGFNVSITA